MRLVLRNICIVFVLALAACATTKRIAAVRAIPVGMKVMQVTNIVGQPRFKIARDDGSEHWIWIAYSGINEESASLYLRDGRVIAPPLEPTPDEPAAGPAVAAAPQQLNTNPPPPKVVEAPPTDLTRPAQEKTSAEIAPKPEPPIQPAAPARELDEKPQLAKRLLDPPPLTAWYMARQLVSEKLAPRRSIFPNPRFAADAAGEERLGGNTWRAWGYVDTVDKATNSPKRINWTAELEFFGGSRWELKKMDLPGE